MKIDDIFDGVWSTDTEYLIKCPYCGDHKTHNHCFINPVTGFFICHYCSEVGTVEKIVKDFGNGESVERSKGAVAKHKSVEIEFHKFHKVSGMKNQLDRMCLTYLKSRGMKKEEVMSYDIRFASYGRYYNRVIFPIVEEGQVVCFVARAISDATKPKYLFPSYGEMLLTTGECLWGLNWALNSGLEQVLIVEGIFDGIATSEYFQTVVLSGKRMTNSQLFKLLRLSRKTVFTIMLDGDARKNIKAIADKLTSYDRKVKVIFLKDKQDPASLTEEEILNAYLNRQDWNLNLNIKLSLENEKWKY